MGSRGLSSKTNSGKTPTKWELNRKNTRNYGITLKERSTKKITFDSKDDMRKSMDEHLATINTLNTMLGLSPALAPRILMEYGGFKNWRTGGDANIDIDQNDATIRIFATSLVDREYTTGAHEYVHALEAWWIRANYDTMIDRVNAWVDKKYFAGSEISFAICENAAIRMGEIKSGQSLTEDTWKKLAGTIHYNNGYASANPSETIAVAVEDILHHGAKATAYSKSIFKELKSTVKDTQKILKRKRKK